MGFVKAIIILTISVILSEMFLRVLDRNKTKPGIKHIKPYLSNRGYIMVLLMTILIILL